MNYTKFAESEILESYETAIDYSGYANKELIAEIEKRGGIEKLKSIIEKQNVLPNERKRISKEVYVLYKTDQNNFVIKSQIKSEIFDSIEMDEIIDSTIKLINAKQKDSEINSRTICGSLIGLVISISINSTIWYYSILQTQSINFIIIPVTLLFAYVLIRILTNQTKNNVLVFFSTFLSAFISLIIGLWNFHFIQ